VVNKLIKIALIGNTNAGKSTLMNSMVGKNVSIINKKINTTQNIIKGITNINDTQIVFYDTPGSNFLNSSVYSQKRLKIDIWTAIEDVDCILYIIDVSKYNYKTICSDIKKINEVKKSIIVIFNKTDLIDNKLILPYIESLNNLNLVEAFFNISAKYKKGINKLSIFLKSKAKNNKWIFNKDEISNKDDIFMANECTRNAILKYLHKEIPYNVIVRNLLFKSLMILKLNNQLI
jgi:GTP-binding protein Era